jgi:hypothetical protein
MTVRRTANARLIVLNGDPSMLQRGRLLAPGGSDGSPGFVTSVIVLRSNEGTG